MKKTLYGNGEPQHSLVTKVDLTHKSTRRTERIAWLVVIAVFSALGSKLIKQLIPIDPPLNASPASISTTRWDHAKPENTTDQTRWQSSVPREPMWFVNPFTGNRDRSPEGLAPWWTADDAAENLLEKIREGYTIGARRFFINRPMGTDGSSHVPGASWLTINKDKRGSIVDRLNAALLDEFDEPVHLVWFVGSDLRDPRDLHGWNQGDPQSYYQIGENDRWDTLIATRSTLGGWISTGASGLAIDHSAVPSERQHFIDLFESLRGDPFRLTIYGEALPLRQTAGGAIMRDEHGTMVIADEIDKMPWVATERVINDRWPAGAPSESMPLNPETTRVFIWYARGTDYGSAIEKRDLIQADMRRGLIPITNDEIMFRTAELIARLRGDTSS